MDAGRPACRLLDMCASTAQPKIAVFRAMHLGEMLCAVPALRALRMALPGAHVTLIGLPWASSFAMRFSKYIDTHVAFPGFPGLPGQPVDLPRLPAFIEDMQQQRFDCVLQMHGSGALTNPVIRTFNAARNAGYYRQGEYCPDPLYYMPWAESQHDILRLARLMEFLGIPVSSLELEFPLTEADWMAMRASHPALPAAGTYVCIHPGARLPARRWPVAHFAEVADRLSAEGLQVVLVGSSQERGIAAAVEARMASQALNLAGFMGLGAFAALLAQARLVICNDTGIAHIAAALHTPSLALCRDSGARRWAPLDHRRHRCVDSAAAQCGHTQSGASMLVMQRVRELLNDTGMPLA